jgi:hypothetical protein
MNHNHIYSDSVACEELKAVDIIFKQESHDKMAQLLLHNNISKNVGLVWSFTCCCKLTASLAMYFLYCYYQYVNHVKVSHRNVNVHRTGSTNFYMIYILIITIKKIHRQASCKFATTSSL